MPLIMMIAPIPECMAFMPQFNWEVFYPVCGLLSIKMSKSVKSK